jgi:predicted Rossmann fold flavoprotein
MSRQNLIVIGGGAAGFFCAVNAARMNRQLKVTLLEKGNKLLSKVRISGGGRCNVTHALFDVQELSRRYPRGQHFIKKSLHQFSAADTVEWFEQRGVRTKTEEDGRMFPLTDSSQTVIDCLMQEADRHGVEILMNREVREVVVTDGGFHIMLANNQEMKADYLCIATGGFPKSTQFDWLRKLGHSIEEPVPSLFTFNLPGHSITALMGVSVTHVKAKIEGTKLSEEGPLLITHWGLSGPAILRLSAWGARELQQKNYAFTVHINWLPQFNEQSLKAAFLQYRQSNPSQKLANFKTVLPLRLWLYILEQSGVDENSRWADFPAKTENLLIKNLLQYSVQVQGKTTFKEEFVTAGGVSLNEIDANTMMSKKHPNLFFAGEVMNIDGITGGFNFQHAWTSGFIAAKSIRL